MNKTLRVIFSRQFIAAAIFTSVSGTHALVNAQSNAIALPISSSAQNTSLWSGTPGQAVLNDDQNKIEKPEVEKTPKTSAQAFRKNNYTTFSQTTKNKSPETSRFNQGYEQHPELGVLYDNVPCDNCYELLGKRTSTQKYFVKEGTEATQFILQSHQYPVHYKDENGQWLTITGHLEKDNAHSGVYGTKGRPVNVSINTDKGFSELKGVTGTITYNRNLELVYIKPDGSENNLGKANWSNYTAGDDGIRVVDAWPGIDIEMSVMVNALKTNFVVKAAMPAYAAGKLVLRDHISTSDGLSLSITKGKSQKGAIQVKNRFGQDAFTINNAIAYEASGDPNSVTELNYRNSGNNTLDIEVPGTMLNKAASAYPLIVDPLVSGTLSSGFTYTAGLFPPAIAATTEYCANTNNVTIPAAATFTDIRMTFNYYGPAGAPWNNAAFLFRINGACNYGWLACAGTVSSSGIPGGTCGIATNTSFWAAAAAWGITPGCIPAYNCNSYTLPFEVYCTQRWTPSAPCVQTVYATANGFTVTIFGSTAMLPVITPAGPTTLCMPSTLALTGSTAGVWSSSAPGIATVSATGVVTGISNGTTNIVLTSSGCTSTLNLTVGTQPTISGTPSICFPGSTTLTGTPGGGAWTSSAPGIATVVGGFVNGVSFGTTFISYNTGVCTAVQPVDVNNPAAVAPVTQPTGITFSGVTPTGATVNFTPNGSTGYLVVASTNPTLYAAPALYTTYAVGSSFGGGIVIGGSVSGGAPPYTTTLLNSNTLYHVFVFAFNNNCLGPQYNLVSPLTGTFNTCVAPTSVPVIGTVGINYIDLSWTASPAGGGFVVPINYNVYAYLDAALTILAPGFPVMAGVGTTYTASGLSTSTQYWFRVAPADACAIMSPVATGLTTCAAVGTIPYLQTFDVGTMIGEATPNCMTSVMQNCVISSVQTNVTFGGTINTNHTAGGTKFFNFVRAGACSVGPWTNQWLLLPRLPMVAGTTYTLSFWYRTNGAAWNSISAQFSTVGTVPPTTSATMGGTPGTIGPGLAGVNSTTYLQYIQTFTVPTSGNYYIGIDAQSSGAAAALLAIDDIEVCAVPTVTATNSTAPYCAPDTVFLASTGTTGVISYGWTGPAGYTSTLANPTGIPYATPGTYTYTLTATNDPIALGYGGYCTASGTTTFTVNAPPAAITGTTALCATQTTTLSNPTPGGTWSSSTPAVATVNTTGVVMGISGGTSTITYNIGGCYSTITVTVTPFPTTITGTLIACLGSTTTLNSTPAGGTWSSSAPAIASVNATTGVVYGATLGTATITYSFGGACYSTATVSVNPLPAPITGSMSICIGAFTTLSSATPGGFWTSSAPAVASVGIVSGLVNGLAVGTAIITYLVSGCSDTALMNIVAATAPIVGPTNVCVGSNITLTNLTSGGSWSSSAPLIGSIGSTTGIVTGLSAGTTTIVYALSSGCSANTVITVNPAPAPIVGASSVCQGFTTTLTHPSPFGTWSSSNTAIATVTVGGGVVNGISATPAPGTTTISYTTASSCVTTMVFTVLPNPAPITGILSMCQGNNTTLSSATPGGTWSSSNAAIASVGSTTGVVNGVSSTPAPGTATISYTIGGGCVITATVTVNDIPAPITGLTSVCVGSTITLSTTTPFVAWAITPPAVASISGSGVVTGGSAGVATVTATNAGGCSVSRTVTVTATPSAITGTLTMCIGSCTTLNSTPAGGVWSYSPAGVVTVTGPGTMCGNIAGTVNVSYTVAGCSATAIATVNALPGTIGGSLQACVSGTTTLTATPAGGLWTLSAGTGTATITPGGVLTGGTAGTVNVTYSLGTGCITTGIVTVNPLPGAITGTLVLCEGVSATLTGTPAGGTWASSATGTASITSPGGTWTAGTTAGTATITYTATTGCQRTTTVTANALPGIITGGTTICVNATTTLSSTPAGGTWTSSNGNATVVPATGVVTGAVAGTATISYGLSTGCYRTIVVLVNGLPTGVTGSLQVCEGSSSTLSGTPAGGTWLSSTPANGTIGSTSGILGGILAGTTTLSYTLPTTCSLTTVATINPLPAAITGTLTVCVGQTTTVNSLTASGTWSSLSPTVTVNATTGEIYGNSAGTATISYTVATGCRVTAVVTVYALPGTLTGTASVCVNSTTTLNSSPAGGSWTSSATGIATIGSSNGVITGISSPAAPANTATITYTLGTGCYNTRTITVNPLPTAITGSLATCVGSTTTLNSTPAGGVWAINPTLVANVTTGGVVSGGNAGTAVVSYTTPVTLCRVTDIVTVYALPANITGVMEVCQGQTTNLSTLTAGGTWTSSNTATATVSSSGAVYGQMTGATAAATVTISYSLGTGCFKSAIVTVNPLPDVITGTLQVCENGTTALSSAPGGGNWTSGATGTATVVATTGVVTGINSGIANISYTLPVTGCYRTAPVTVNALPSVITGPSEVCVNNVISLSSTPLGGTWSSTDATVSIPVPGTGDVTGISAGTAIISYTVGTGCVRTKTITVNALPAPTTGNLGVCIGNTTLLSTLSTGGVWSSTNPGIASISASGLVTSVSVGTTTISYTFIATGCANPVIVTVYALPAPITGSNAFCNFDSTTYVSSPGVNWTSSDPTILTIGYTSGVAVGVTAGPTVNITATDPFTGCQVSKNVYLILAPYPITGPGDVCRLSTITLGNVIGGGAWSSVSPAIASVAPATPTTATVTGNSAGTTTITYILSTSCYSTAVITVNPIPAGITGSLQVCEGLTTTLGNTTPGGVWSSGDAAVATIGSTSGIATGIDGGIADSLVTITYQLGSGCNAQVVLTVHPLPDVITGNPNVCEGLTTVLASGPAGGAWSSADPSVASVNSGTGIVTGVSSLTTGVNGMGMTVITYTLPTSCIQTKDITVNPLPTSITGAMNVCVGDITILSNATPGGTWQSSDGTKATVDASGIVTGISAGSVVISYTLPTGCIATWPMTVNDNPAPIGGSLTVCAGFATNLNSSPAGGTWSQTPTSMIYGTIHSITGVVSGIMAGVVPVTYTIGSGCRTVEAVTVITLPAVISGNPRVCEGLTTTMSNPVPGGTWSISNPAIATIDAGGVVTGITAGTTVVTYMVSTGCFNVHTITVNPLPAPISGVLQVCEGFTTLLTSSGSGQWFSGAIAVATAGISTGIITGISAGTAPITYSLLGTGCIRTATVTVNQTPGAIIGNPHICMGSTVTYTNGLAGGTWISSHPLIATIDNTTGVATPVTLGTTTISYILTATGCYAKKEVTVQPLPVVYNVTGGGSYCAGGNGVAIGLDNSQPGVSYVLYRGSSVTGYLSGSGFPLNFGLHTAAGVYTVQATNVTSGCVKDMAGSATIAITPLTTPAVTIAASPTDSVCPGETVTLSPVTTTGGTTPTYLWKVNGVSVSTGTTYSFIPANGDVATVTMTSNANCLALTTANASKTLTVLPTALPVVNATVTPNDTVCQFNPVTFTANAVYGGNAPVYTWMVNGAATGTTGTSYTFVPVDGEVVSVRMVSNYRCRLRDTVMSEGVVMSVDAILLPHVTIVATPGLSVETGKPVTLTAYTTDAGSSPSYQWKVNGFPVAGATQDTYTSIFNDYDSILCEIVSSGVCHNIGTSDWVFITVSPLGSGNVGSLSGDIRLLPNPNKGLFTIRGTLGNALTGTVDADVTNMLGQVVYRGVLNAKNGMIDTQVQLDNTIANGMYILTLRSGNEQKVFHFVMEQ